MGSFGRLWLGCVLCACFLVVCFSGIPLLLAGDVGRCWDGTVMTLGGTMHNALCWDAYAHPTTKPATAAPPWWPSTAHRKATHATLPRRALPAKRTPLPTVVPLPHGFGGNRLASLDTSIHCLKTRRSTRLGRFFLPPLLATPSSTFLVRRESTAHRLRQLPRTSTTSAVPPIARCR